MYEAKVKAKVNKFTNHEVRVVSRWEPTRQRRSRCGYQWGKLSTCQEAGLATR